MWPLGAIAGEIGLGVVRDTLANACRSGCTRSIAALARPVSGIARGSMVSLNRAPFVGDCFGQPLRRNGQRPARRRFYRPAVEPDGPAFAFPLDANVLPESLHGLRRSCSSHALLEQPRREEGVDHAHDRDDGADLRPAAGPQQVGVDDRHPEEEDRKPARAHQRISEQPVTRLVVIHRRGSE